MLFTRSSVLLFPARRLDGPYVSTLPKINAMYNHSSILLKLDILLYSVPQEWRMQSVSYCQTNSPSTFPHEIPGCLFSVSSMGLDCSLLTFEHVDRLTYQSRRKPSKSIVIYLIDTKSIRACWNEAPYWSLILAHVLTQSLFLWSRSNCKMVRKYREDLSHQHTRDRPPPACQYPPMPFLMSKEADCDRSANFTTEELKARMVRLKNARPNTYVATRKLCWQSTSSGTDLSSTVEVSHF